MEFGTILRDLRQSKGMTQAELGGKVGLTYSIIGMYENGVRKPSVDALVRLADFFGVSIDYILGRTLDFSVDKSTDTPVPENACVADRNTKYCFMRLARKYGITDSEIKTALEFISFLHSKGRRF